MRLLWPFLLLFVCNANTDGLRPKHVIGNRSYCGLWSEVFEVLANLHWCEKNGYDPVVWWAELSAYYDPRVGPNVWEYYFEPVSNAVYQAGDRPYHYYHAPDGSYIPYITTYSQKQREFFHALMNRYMRLKPALVKKIEDFWQEQCAGKIIIGIHLRRTDKNNELGQLPEVDVFCDAALNIIMQENLDPAQCAFLVATDDELALERGRELLGASRVIAYNARRSTNGVALHHYQTPSSCRAQTGQEALIETYLLARAAYFVRSISNLAEAVTCINPQIKDVCIFPENAILPSGENKYVWPEEGPIFEQLSPEEHRRINDLEDEYREKYLKYYYAEKQKRKRVVPILRVINDMISATHEYPLCAYYYSVVWQLFEKQKMEFLSKST